MKRREFALGLTGLAASLPTVLSLGMGAADAAVVTTVIGSKRFGPILPPAAMLRLDLLTMQFSATAAAVDIDLLLDVGGALMPFRVASFRAGAVSPQSRPFGFALDQRALAGFRVGQCQLGRGVGSGLGNCTTSVETPYRLPAVGNYVLDIDRTGMAVMVSALKAGQGFDDPVWLAARKNQSFMAFSVSHA
jgi:hypothetical protein